MKNNYWQIAKERDAVDNTLKRIKKAFRKELSSTHPDMEKVEDLASDLAQCERIYGELSFVLDTYSAITSKYETAAFYAERLAGVYPAEEE
jgi:hypothetical protein